MDVGCVGLHTNARTYIHLAPSQKSILHVCEYIWALDKICHEKHLNAPGAERVGVVIPRAPEGLWPPHHQGQQQTDNHGDIFEPSLEQLFRNNTFQILVGEADVERNFDDFFDVIFEARSEEATNHPKRPQTIRFPLLGAGSAVVPGLLEREIERGARA